MRNIIRESDMIESLKSKFEKYTDFTVVPNESLKLKNITLQFDLVIKYGGQSVACVEVKAMEELNGLKHYMETILRFSGVSFCFAVVNDSFKYYELSSGEIVDKNEDDILKMLSESVSINSVEGNEQKEPIIELINAHQQWGDYGDKLKEYLQKEKLKRCGCYVFLEENIEKEFMLNLLLTSSNRIMPKELCRYTSANSFFLSLKNGFRISSVEAMNDEFETKVIDEYPNLQPSLNDLPNYLHHGFILSFSIIERKDKLLQWYMYGDKATGVCITVEPKDNNNAFWAPIVYIPKGQKGDKLTLLDFLNQLVGVEIEDIYHFKLRYWHFWKYFFKYDFYQEEKEFRMLIVQEEKGDTAWSKDHDIPYHYISKDRDDMPFIIKEVMFGPRFKKSGDFRNYLLEVMGDSIGISSSKIIGYR